MKKTIGKILYIILLIILIPVLLLNLIIMGKSLLYKDEVPSVFGIKPMIVLSNSMDPNIKKNDLVFVKEVDTDTLKENDIISFRDNENTIITHRISRIEDENGVKKYYTMGDYTQTEDKEFVLSEQIEGKYINKISKIGGVIEWIQTPLGIVVIVLVLIIVILLIILLPKAFNNKDAKLMKEFEEFKKKQELNN